MSLTELVLAGVLMTGTEPPTSAQINLYRQDYPTLPETLRRVAADLELLDPREFRYVLVSWDDFANDLQMIQRRHRDLADAPLVGWSLKYPTRVEINEMLNFNRAYRQHLESQLRLEVHRENELRTALSETDHLYRVWDTIRDTQCNYYYVSVRRLALKQLREMIGEEAFLQDQLPPPVPSWRFVEK